MRVSQEHADEWVSHLIRTGGNEQTVEVKEQFWTNCMKAFFDSCGCPKCKRKRAGKAECENCGRETEFLFEGYKEPPQLAAVEIYHFRGKPATRDQIRALCEPFLTEKARVCMGCRPLSNLEIEEILSV